MNSTSIQPSHSRWKAVLLLVLIFILGAGCGVGGGLLVLRRVLLRAIDNKPGEEAPVDLLVAKVEREISSELQLDDTQRKVLREDLKLTASQFKDLRLHVTQEARRYIQEALTRSGEHLPAEKRAALREMVTKRLQPWGLMSQEQ